ncbi:hypothetical protein DPMN_183832 [Dreissena polymorpha]|uniref:Uncharacterized protein n=1 Tax=Dreissena polymorpha TaxID=45954 RepID=A0A9D4I5U1_DREPO|nr:hypothetical protein DPMN_183832 [Dreissena polymorpha]
MRNVKGIPVPPFLSTCCMSTLCLRKVSNTWSAPLPAAHMNAVLPSTSASSVTLARDRNTSTVS